MFYGFFDSRFFNSKRMKIRIGCNREYYLSREFFAYAMKYKAKKNSRIVVIGGGTGVFTVLSGLKKYPMDLTAVVTMADDGGSTGVLREEFGILPPGDVRRALVALSHSSDHMMADLFNYRFREGGFMGHTFGNIMLTALERLTGSFEQAVIEAAKLLRVRGMVYPVTFDDVRLCAELEDGSIVRGETNIDIPRHNGNLKIKRVFLDSSARINIRARDAILASDMIVVGPGDLYTSIVPNLLVRGVPEAIRKSGAKKIYVVNLMTKWGETTGFHGEDFIHVVENYVGRHVLDYVCINMKRPSADRLKMYEKESSEFVAMARAPSDSFTNRGSAKNPTPIFGDFLRRRGFVRHDPERLAKVLVSLL